MQNILSVDLSTSPVTAAVFSVAGHQSTLLEVCPKAITKTIPPLSKLLELNQFSTQSANDDDLLGEASDTEIPSLSLVNYTKAITNMLEALDTQWVASVVILPTDFYTSLSVELPFDDHKAIRQVIDLEVQDLVPFDIDEFVVSHTPVARIDDNRHEIHVSLYVRDALKAVLSAFQKAQCDPFIVGSPSSFLMGIADIPDLLPSEPTAVMYLREKTANIGLLEHGHVRADRSVSLDVDIPKGSTKPSISLPSILSIEQTLRSFERLLGSPIGEVFVCGDISLAEAISTKTARTMQWISSDKLVTILDPLLHLDSFHDGHDASSSEPISSSTDESALVLHDQLLLPAVATFFARDIKPLHLVGNLRVGDFAYRPQFSRLLTGCKPLLPLVAGVLALGLLLASSWFLLENYRRTELRQRMIAEVSKNVSFPVVVPDNQDVSQWVREQSAIVEAGLNKLGSPSTFTPLDILKALSEDIARARKLAPELIMNKADIGSMKVIIEGTVPDYEQLGDLETILKERSTMYCDVKRGTITTSGEGARAFNFSIQLCEV
jgi:hypothetical protein